MIVLSIIIPVYNVREYIRKCILSIVDQLDERMQVIIVDDGSTDQSMKQIDDLCEKSQYISVYRKQNGGLSSARNFGFEKAGGRYVYFVDSDDSIEPGTLGLLADRLESDSEPCYKISYRKICSKPAEATTGFEKMNITRYLRQPKTSVTNVWKYIVSADFLRASKISFREGVYCEDIEWVTRLFLNLDTIVISELGVYIYNNIRPESIMNSASAKLVHDTFSNIYLCMLLINEVSDEGKKLLIKKKLFIEWCSTLSSYHSNRFKSTIEVIDCFSNESGSIWFVLTKLILGCMSIDSFAMVIHWIYVVRKTILRIFIKEQRKYNE